MRALGDKVSARHIAIGAGVPVVHASESLPDDDEAIRRIAAEIGYPLMLKASWGGGRRGMRPIKSEAGLIEVVRSGKRAAKAAFGRDEVYLEKLIRRACLRPISMKRRGRGCVMPHSGSAGQPITGARARSSSWWTRRAAPFTSSKSTR